MTNLHQKRTLWSVRGGYANVNLMKTKFWDKYQPQSVWFFVHKVLMVSSLEQVKYSLFLSV